MTADSAATACARHMPVPSTSATARVHAPRGRHGAQNPSGSNGCGSLDVMPGSSRPRHHERMPWSNSRPRSRRYGREHRAERARHMRALERAGAGLCAEVVCLYRSRVITPDMHLHLAHDPTGTVVLGLAHARCNTHEASVRARRMQTQPTRARLEQQHARTDDTW